MKLFRSLNQLKNIPPLALTIGNFDGVHRGHFEIISTVKKIAKEKNLASAILTFEPHPISFLNPAKPRDFRITSLAQKLKIFRDAGIDYVIVLTFNKNLAEISAEYFAKEILAESLNAKHLVIGYDFTFGKNRQGNFKLLEEKNFALSEISPLKDAEQTCSSTLVRRLLLEGKVAEANRILGRNFTIEGIVNEGKKLGAELGFPTMNLMAKPQIIKPKFGIYKTATFIPHLGKKFISITSFGIRPTVNELVYPLFETYIPGFSEKTYGKKIRVEFLDFMREEKKFASLEELKAQIKADVAQLDSKFFAQ